MYKATIRYFIQWQKLSLRTHLYYSHAPPTDDYRTRRFNIQIITGNSPYYQLEMKSGESNQGEQFRCLFKLMDSNEALILSCAYKVDYTHLNIERKKTAFFFYPGQ